MSDDRKEKNRESSPDSKKRRPYIKPDFEEESVFETLAAGCTFNNPRNQPCNPALGGVVGNS